MRYEVLRVLLYLSKGIEQGVPELGLLDAFLPNTRLGKRALNGRRLQVGIKLY